MGQADTEPLKEARIFIQKLEMLQELCINNPDRVIDLDEKKKKDVDKDEEDEDKKNEELEFLNISELQ